MEMVHTVQNSNFIGAKAFINHKDKIMAIFIGPSMDNDKDFYVVLDKNDKIRIMEMLRVDNQFKMDFVALIDGLGTKEMVINELNSYKPGFNALGYKTIYLGEAFINDENVLKINW